MVFIPVAQTCLDQHASCLLNLQSKLPKAVTVETFPKNCARFLTSNY